jgi:hypothetical protein
MLIISFLLLSFFFSRIFDKFSHVSIFNI